ncbi:TMEM43 family protein [Pseudomarimonas arenosa]|uniref:TMEM43 family protein n=1 Tax=Pseudomarimonas arenosa TaxID=2774145 RepID=A0AAW3ZM76_9GAMM|nr:TMEM43 family protein [Pseudomarimonas arenosa]MBD8526580.1 TMEM43 family protein [Pseudomarimonas arenosa]
MAIETISRQGWFSRLKGAFFGILFGLIFVAGAAALQFWNEGRTLRQARLLEAGRQDVVELSAMGAESRRAGGLAYVHGELRADGQRLDPEFNQVAEGLGLRRRVEMFQWKERKETKEETSVGGSKTTRTRYYYEQVWDDELIDSDRFQEAAGHQNPERMPFESQTWKVEKASLADLQVEPEVLSEVGGWRPMAPQADRLPGNLAASLGVEADRLTTVNGEPQIGDVRIHFERLPDGPVSVVGRVQGDRLGVERRELGELLLLERGEHSAEQLFSAAESRNSGLGWAIRVGGFVLMWIGFGMVFGPLAVFADILPFLGRLTRMVTGLISGVLAGLISFVAIASGWLYHRPWLLGLIVIAIAGLIAWIGLRARKPTPLAPPSSMPPPPPLS